MINLNEVITSNAGIYILLTAIITNFLAQITKFFIYKWKYKKINYKILISTGGMPSSHTAFIISAVISLGIICGFNTPIFALSLVFALIVIFDSLGIRRQAGKQAKVINCIINDFNELTSMYNRKEHVPKEIYEKKLKEFLGHEPIEVLGGLLFGILSTFLLFSIFNKLIN